MRSYLHRCRSTTAAVGLFFLAYAHLSPRPIQALDNVGTAVDTVPQFTLAYLRRVAAVQHVVDSLQHADPTFAAAWQLRGVPTFQKRLVASTPVLQHAYTAHGLTVSQEAATIGQLREIYLRAQALRTQHPDTDVTEVIDPAMRHTRWGENFVFIESHRNAVRALGLVVHALPAIRPVMDVVDSTDPGRAASQATPAVATTPLRILFIGNSLTYVNDVPANVRAIAAQGLHRRIVTRAITIPGAALTDLWQRGRGVAARVLAEHQWDVVVLQGRLNQWTAPQRHTMDALIQSVDTTSYNAIVRAVAQYQRARHGQTLLFLPPQGADESDETRIGYDRIHAYAGKQLRIPVAHGGTIVHQMTATRPHLHTALFEPDNEHPSAMGAYLQALVIYTALTRQSPVGLSHPVAPGLTDSLALFFEHVVTGETAAVGASSHQDSRSLPRPVLPSLVTHLVDTTACAPCAWVTAYALSSNAKSFAASVDPLPGATSADSLDLWAYLVNDTAHAGHPAALAVRAKQHLQTGAAASGIPLQRFAVPALQASDDLAQLHLIVVATTRAHDRFLGAAVVPLPVVMDTLEYSRNYRGH